MKEQIVKNGILLLLIVLLSFVLPRAIPGSPLSYAENDTYILNQTLPEEAFNAFEDYYAPDKPLVEQFGLYLSHLLQLDLGYSFYYKLPVAQLIGGRLKWTLILAIPSILISTLLAIMLGICAAYSKRLGKVSITTMLGIQAVPAFLVAVFMQGLFAYKLNLFPATGAYTPGMLAGEAGFYADLLQHLLLPFITLLLCEIPGIFLITFYTTQKIRNENFVTMGRYLGFSPHRVNLHIIAPNIFLEIAGKLRVQVIFALTGTLFVESVFSYPGVGLLMRQAAASRDYPLLQGLLLTFCIGGLLVNLLFDLLTEASSQRF